MCVQGLSSTLLPADGVTAPTGLSFPVSTSLARCLDQSLYIMCSATQSARASVQTLMDGQTREASTPPPPPSFSLLI